MILGGSVKSLSEILRVKKRQVCITWHSLRVLTKNI